MPNRDSKENRKGGGKRQSSHFSLLPQISVHRHLEQKHSLTARIGVLETRKERERCKNPTARSSCLLIYLLHTLFIPSLILGEKKNYVY